MCGGIIKCQPHLRGDGFRARAGTLSRTQMFYCHIPRLACVMLTGQWERLRQAPMRACTHQMWPAAYLLRSRRSSSTPFWLARNSGRDSPWPRVRRANSHRPGLAPAHYGHRRPVWRVSRSALRSLLRPILGLRRTNRRVISMRVDPSAAGRWDRKRKPYAGDFRPISTEPGFGRSSSHRARSWGRGCLLFRRS